MYWNESKSSIERLVAIMFCLSHLVNRSLKIAPNGPAIKCVNVAERMEAVE
jgi:hypothetical protein